MNNKDIIARKYAKAFLNLYEDQISLEDLDNIRKLEHFFASHKKVIFFLSVPNIQTITKEKLLDELFQRFNLKTLLNPLVHLLSNSKRLFLIDNILTHIKLIYKKRNDITRFTITSSHEMPPQDIKIIEKFLACQTNKTIISTYNIDKKLIAGIRLQSDTLLWEYSIGKQCNTLCKQFDLPCFQKS